MASSGSDRVSGSDPTYGTLIKGHLIKTTICVLRWPAIQGP